MQAISNKH